MRCERWRGSGHLEPDWPPSESRPTAPSSRTRWWHCGRRPQRLCGKRLKVMIPTPLPALERHGRLKLDKAQRAVVVGVSAATIDRLLIDTKIAAAGGKRRRVGFYSAVRREVPIQSERSMTGTIRARLLRGGHGGTWRNLRSRLVHPDADDGRCGDRLDRSECLR